MDIMYPMLIMYQCTIHTIYNIISLNHEVNMQQNNVTVGRQIFKITAYSLKIIHYVYKNTPNIHRKDADTQI